MASLNECRLSGGRFSEKYRSRALNRKEEEDLGKADTVTKRYAGQNDVFADAFNYYFYGGRQVIKPELLHELDTAELTVPYGADGAGHPVQKYRDILKMASVMEDGKAAYLLLGIENQSAVSYAAPVRGLLYDALQYARQVELAAKSHREAADGRGHTEGEFLSGFYREDKLLPVITLIIQFSPEAWTGPRTLHEMLSVKDPAVLELVPDYRIHLLSPWEISEEEAGKFHTSLGNVLTFIKYSNDREKMDSWMKGAGAQVWFGREEVEVLNTCVSARLRMDEDEEAVKMCEAFRLLIEEAAEAAAKEAAEKAAREAAKETEKKQKETKERMQILSIRNIMRNLHLTTDQAIQALEIPDSDAERIREILQQ